MKVFIVALFILGSTLPAYPTNSEYVIALKPDKNPEQMLADRKIIEAELTKLTGKPVKVVIPLSASTIHQGFSNGTVDVGYLSAMDMIQAKSKQQALLMLSTTIKNQPSYQSIWLVKKTSPYQSVADLKNKPIAFASRTSTSGYLVPYAHLIKQGLLNPQQSPESFFGKNNVTWGSGYASAVQRVLNGQAEAAAVSDYVFLGNKYLSPTQKSQLRMLQSQGPVPTHVFAARSSLTESDLDILKKSLLKLQADKPTLFSRIFAEGVSHATESQHLAPLQEYLEVTGLGKELGVTF